MRRLVILTPDNAPLWMNYAAWGQAMRTMRVVCRNWSILVADRHGPDAEIVRCCQTYHTDYTIVGVTLSPSNGAKGHYLRLLPAGTRPEKREARDRYLVESADRVVCIVGADTDDEVKARHIRARDAGVLHLYEYAKSLGKEAILRFTDDPAYVAPVVTCFEPVPVNVVKIDPVPVMLDKVKG